MPTPATVLALQRLLPVGTPAGRALLALSLGGFFMAVFLGLHCWGLLSQDIRSGLNVSVVWGLQGVLATALTLLAGAALWLWPRRHAADSLPRMEALLTLAIGVPYTFIAIGSGIFTSGPNLVMIGILTVGLLLFTRRAMLLAFAVCVLLFTLADLALWLDAVRYAPAITARAFEGGSPRWWWDTWWTCVMIVGMVVVLGLIMALFAQLETLHARLRHLSITDGLTGLSNRRFFVDRLAAEVRRQSRTRRPLSLVLIDADHFKQVNDRHGHATGDRVLEHLAAVLSTGVRLPTDVAARMGGEEFALLLPDTTLDEAEAVCWRLQRRLAGQRIEVDGQPLGVTISMGVIEAMGQPPEVVLREADVQLYLAKQGGRDRASYASMRAMGGDTT